MARRQAGAGPSGPPRRRWGVFSLAALAVLAAGGWLAPAVLVHTSLRDRPLEAACAGIQGSIGSRSARWSWLGPIEYRDVVLRDTAGRPAAVVESLSLERGILGLAVDPRSLGTVRLAGLEARVAVRRGGSSLEDILAPWLAAPRTGPGVACDLELAGATAEFIDTDRNETWRIGELFAAGTLRSDGSLAGWTAAGRLRHAAEAPGKPLLQPAAAGDPPRFDRAAVPAAAAAVLARDGGWSISAPAGSPGAIAVTANRLPLGASSVLATRFGFGRLLDGLADLRLDMLPAAEGSEVRGRIAIERLAVCRADTLAEEFAVERCELPLHVTLGADAIAVHELRFSSPVARGEVAGRLAWPSADAWSWLDGCVGRDAALAAEVDLAAFSRALPGGLAVRPDVRVTGGSLQLSAVSRGDGSDRVLELRLAARDLSAVRSGAEGGDGERPLRWNEPFTGWLRARRGPTGGAGLLIEEGRLASPAAELSASGTPAALKIQWTADLGGLVGELAEVLDVGGLTVTGTCRGRLDVERAAGGLTSVKTSASIADFVLGLAELPPWRDESISLDVEATGSFSGGLTVIETGRGMISARGDALEATLSGGAAVDLAAILAGRPEGWLPPAGGERAPAADCSLVGDLGRWQMRLAPLVPALAAPGLELAGSVRAAAAVAAEPGGGAWRITKAGGEIERFMLRHGDRRAGEPRIVVTAAGTIRPAAGSLEISSAELLSSTLSLRSGGVSWAGPEVAADASASGLLEAILAGVRGRVQWQADLGRIEPWLVAADVADRWPVTGRAWGTLDVARTPAGTNALVEATGSQVSIGRREAGGEAPAPRAVWTEPQATIALELTRPPARSAGPAAAADRLVIDRLEIASSTLAVAARGSVADWSGSRQATLEGTASYDWEQLSRLATPWTGGRIRVKGSGGRPFVARATLGVAARSAGPAPPPTPGTLRLPDDWLTAISAPAAGDPVAGRAVARRQQPAAADERLAALLGSLAIDTSAAWAAADIAGFPVAAGDVAIRLFEGQLALGPFDLEAGGGRVRGAPWLRLVPPPGELVVPPGRIVDRVAVSGETCQRLVAVVSPLLAGTTRTAGLVSLDLAGARLPLGDPLAGAAAGQVLFEQLEVTPGGAMQPLAGLLARLQGIIDPRFALGDKLVLLRVRPEPIRLRLADRRIWHEGLVMESGGLTVSSRGSVGEDGSLAAVVEVAIRADLAGQAPLIDTLLRTPISVPLKGTLARPQFDAGAIDGAVRRVLENTSRALIDEGIGRGLEAVFGSPPRPPAAR